MTTCSNDASEDILNLAGSTHVIKSAQQMGSFLSRRICFTDNFTHLIGNFEEVQIAEVNIHGTPLVGQRLKHANLREEYGVNVVGMWERGTFELPAPDAMLNNHTVLLLAGTETNFKKYDEAFKEFALNTAPVIIIGAGRVGRETAKALEEMGIPYRFIESDEKKAGMVSHAIVGDASDKAVLERAGINKSPAVVITVTTTKATYLTIYCRKLRPDIQIVTRAFVQRNVEPLHRAGADFVISQNHMGATSIFNLLRRAKILMVTEGLDVFSQKTPDSLVAVKVKDSKIREKTGCSIVAIRGKAGTVITPSPEDQFCEEGEIILIGDEAAEKAFEERFCST